MNQAVEVVGVDGSPKTVVEWPGSGGGPAGTIAPWSRAFYVDPGTSVPGPDQNGSSATPFASIQDAIDAATAAAGAPTNEACAIMLAAGDYPSTTWELPVNFPLFIVDQGGAFVPGDFHVTLGAGDACPVSFQGLSFGNILVDGDPTGAAVFDLFNARATNLDLTVGPFAGSVEFFLRGMSTCEAIFGNTSGVFVAVEATSIVNGNVTAAFLQAFDCVFNGTAITAVYSLFRCSFGGTDCILTAAGPGNSVDLETAAQFIAAGGTFAVGAPDLVNQGVKSSSYQTLAATTNARVAGSLTYVGGIDPGAPSSMIMGGTVTLDPIPNGDDTLTIDVKRVDLDGTVTSLLTAPVVLSKTSPAQQSLPFVSRVGATPLPLIPPGSGVRVDRTYNATGVSSTPIQTTYVELAATS